MSCEHLQVMAPTRAYADATMDLVAKVFSDDGGYYNLREACREVYVEHSHYDWEASRIGVLGGRVVTHYGVWKYQMRVGRARVQAGGVGAVATDYDYRRRGLMDHTAWASLEAMRAQGYDVSLLFGIENFYHRYGYVRAWADTTYYVRASDLPRERPQWAFTKFRPRRQPERAARYNAEFDSYTGTAVRPTYLRVHPSWTGNIEGYQWRVEGALAGYVIVTRNGNQVRCIEYTGDARQALRVLGALARTWHSEQMHFATIPHGSELVKLIRRGNCRTESHYRRSGGAMIALLNLRAMLEKMQEELTCRAQQSPLATWRGDVLIASPQEQVLLKLRRGQVRVAPPAESAHVLRGGPALAQLLIGSEPPSEVIEAGGMEVAGEAGAVAEALFPAQQPQLSQLDRF